MGSAGWVSSLLSPGAMGPFSGRALLRAWFLPLLSTLSAVLLVSLVGKSLPVRPSSSQSGAPRESWGSEPTFGLERLFQMSGVSLYPWDRGGRPPLPLEPLDFLSPLSLGGLSFLIFQATWMLGSLSSLMVSRKIIILWLIW